MREVQVTCSEMGSQLSAKVKAESKHRQESESTPKTDMVSGQIELARRMAERQMAMQVATVREMMVWFVPFTLSSYGFLYYGYIKTNSWVVLFPLIPITFGLGYQLHYAYGNKTNAIKGLAENIMTNESHMMMVPEWSSSSSDLLQITTEHKSLPSEPPSESHFMKQEVRTSLQPHPESAVSKPLATNPKQS